MLSLPLLLLLPLLSLLHSRCCCHRCHCCHPCPPRCHFFHQFPNHFFHKAHIITENEKTKFAGNQKIFNNQLIWRFKENNLCHSHLSSLLQHYAFFVRCLLVCFVKLLGFEFMKQFTSLLTWVDGASFNQLFLVSVWNSCFQVNIKLFDLLQSIGRVFYIDFCHVRVSLARENHLLQKYCYLWRLIISTLHMHQSIFFLIKICYQ